MNHIIKFAVLLILLSGCNSDKNTPDQTTSQAPLALKAEESDIKKEKQSSESKEGSTSKTQSTPVVKLKKKEEKAIIKKVQTNQVKFEEEEKKEAEARRKSSKYKDESCDVLIQKIEAAVNKAISDPDDEVNLKFLYDINLDQSNADCKKDEKYDKKFQALMKKWDDS